MNTHKRKKGFYRQLEDHCDKVAHAMFGCDGNELLVHLYLKSKGIRHEMQKRVEMPVVARKSSYIIVDFVLPDYHGHVVWIEYNGSQHEVYNRRYHRSYEDFLRQQNRDRVEQDYCDANGITLINLRHSHNFLKTLRFLQSQLDKITSN